jgi:hypothetical protein
MKNPKLSSFLNHRQGLAGLVIVMALSLNPVSSRAQNQSAALSSWPPDTNHYWRALMPEDFFPRAKAPLTVYMCDVVVSNSDTNLKNTDTWGDEEPSIAINPANPNEIIIVAFSGDWGSTAPWFHSTNGGLLWTKRSTIPVPTGLVGGGPDDQSIDYGRNSQISGAYLRTDGNVYVGTSTNPANTAAFKWFAPGGTAAHANSVGAGNADQPWLLVNPDPSNPAQDNVYLAYDNFAGSPDMRVAVSRGLNPPIFTNDVLVGLSTGFVNPGHRMAKDPRTGYIYSLWQRRIAAGSGGSQNINFMLNRSTNGGASWSLNGSATGIIVGNGDSTQPTPKFGTVNALLGGVDHAAVDPKNGAVYYAYGKRDAATSNNRLAMRRLADNGAGGLTIGPEVFITGQVQAALPSVAVNTNGVVAVLYDTFDGFSNTFPVFTAHVAVSSDNAATFTDTPLYNFLSSAKDNSNTRQRVLGDYQQIKALGANFYGVFTANGAGLGRPIANHDPIFFKFAVGDTINITQQPTNQTVFEGDNVTFTVGVSGTPPLAYQWRFNGAAINRATNSTLVLTGVVPSQSGNYSVVVTNSTGSVTSSNAVLSVTPIVPLPVALNSPGLIWTTDGNAVWHGLTNVSHDGVAAGQSGSISTGQVSRLSIVLTGPATISFWWKVSCLSGADGLSFLVNNVPQARISGEVDWTQSTFYLADGNQTLQWVYAKGANGSAGQNLAWVDEFAYASTATPPTILTQPASQGSIGGAPVIFTVSAVGTPQLSYQWRFNGANISGATTNSLTIASPQSTNNGAYSVRITNAYGSVISSDAYLGVVPFAVAGDNSLGQIAVAAGASNAIAIAAGAWHSLALRSDGKVVAWGNNDEGQCDVPPNLGNVVQIAAGGYHNLALKPDGTVVAWGANGNGQSSVPATVSNVIAIAAGTWYSLALQANGKVVGWGDNSWGQTTVPVALANVIAIAAGGSHSLALHADGTVLAWGQNTDSQGVYAGQSDVPANLANVVAISAGDYHSLAVRSDGTMALWGDDSQGQTDVPGGLTGIVTMAGGGSHNVALRNNRTMAAWGNNWSGQCNLPGTLSNVVAIAAGGLHTLALLGPAQPPRLFYPIRSGNQFSLLVQTTAGKNYALQYKDSLTATSWTELFPIYGLGTMQFLFDPAATVPQRLYRVRQW